MKLNFLSILSVSTFVLVATTSQHSAVAAAEPMVVKIDGSSTVFPVTEAVAEEFQIAEKGQIKVTVGISGTGGGFKKFCRGETDVSDASRPISKEEIEACKKSGISFYELPVGFDAIVIAVNPKNDWISTATIEDLKKMWEPAAQGKITKWNQVNPKWPDQAIKLFGAGSDSGTFDYFTEAIVGKSKSSRGDYTGSEDDNTLVQGISTDKYALGYLPYSYYDSNRKKMKALAVDGGAKAPKKGGVLPSPQAVIDGTYYPLSRPVFIYVNAKSAEKPEIKKFVEFYLKNAEKLVNEVKLVSLPAKSYVKALENFSKKKLGTVFAGEGAIGITIDKLLKKEAVN